MVQLKYMRYSKHHLRRQIMAVLVMAIIGVATWAFQTQSTEPPVPLSPQIEQQYFGDESALATLESLEVKGRAPKTNYARNQFGDGWGDMEGCRVREAILARDLTETAIDDKCRVQSGVLHDPYTGATVQFRRGGESSQAVQIDHVVALSDAWQKGAQNLTFSERVALANDPLNLLAVDGPTNQNKGDGDAATWLPPNKAFRCQYIARQVAVKKKYRLWVTAAEKEAMGRVLERCAPA